MKRILLFVLLSLTSFTMLLANSNKESSSTTDEISSSDGKLFSKPQELSLMVQSHPSWPYQDNWYVQTAIKDRTNMNLKVMSIIDSNQAFREKLNLTMATGDIPDLIFTNSKEVVKLYGNQGPFLNILDNLDKLPNFKKWLSSNGEYVKKFMSNDGSLYMFPERGVEEGNRRGWLYREDIFNKHNLEIPTDSDELYTVLKQLKKIYPDSYPLTFRSGMRQFLMMAPSWGTDWQASSSNHQLYYNRDASEWGYGPIEDNFKDLVAFINKLYTEDLIPLNFMSLTTKEWQDLVSNDNAFITLDYLTRIDFFNSALRESNPDFTLRYMAPIKGGDNGKTKMAATATGLYGMIPSAMADRDVLLKYCDWLYSDEAADLLSWGEEGKTFNVVDGKREFIEATDVASIRKLYGLSTYGFFFRFDFTSHMSTFSPLVNEAVIESRKYDLPENPLVEFTDSEAEIAQTIGVNIDDFTQQETSKFLLGIRDLSEWDQYVQEVEKLGLSKLREIYNSAYQRQ
ncbi:MAG: extracellular solute-binding protein [Spirochaetaceae bacterium]